MREVYGNVTLNMREVYGNVTKHYTRSHAGSSYGYLNTCALYAENRITKIVSFILKFVLKSNHIGR